MGFETMPSTPVLAGQAMEGRTLADLVIVVLQLIPRAAQQRCQPRLAVNQRQGDQIFAVEKQQIEQEKNQPPTAIPARPWRETKARATEFPRPEKADRQGRRPALPSLCRSRFGSG